MTNVLIHIMPDKTKAYLILANSTVAEIVPANGTDFRLPELYEALDCRTIEVAYPKTQNGNILIIDEEGKLRDTDVVVNEFATVLYGYWPDDAIVGNAIYCPSHMLK